MGEGFINWKALWRWRGYYHHSIKPPTRTTSSISLLMPLSDLSAFRGCRIVVLSPGTREKSPCVSLQTLRVEWMVEAWVNRNREGLSPPKLPELTEPVLRWLCSLVGLPNSFPGQALLRPVESPQPLKPQLQLDGSYHGAFPAQGTPALPFKSLQLRAWKK